MRTERFLCYSSGRVWGGGLVLVGCIWGPGGFGCCPYWGGGSVVVDFLFIVTPVEGGLWLFYVCCALLCVHSSIAVILVGKRELVALLGLYSWCLMVVGWLFLVVPWSCL